mmetsp:Transcript_87415/g.173504  ORF Transcript_87415/g.173504 Transcript_87415/m.173504 type:complete len:165 (+) Transcript_87415:92-586(+)
MNGSTRTDVQPAAPTSAGSQATPVPAAGAAVPVKPKRPRQPRNSAKETTSAGGGRPKPPGQRKKAAEQQLVPIAKRSSRRAPTRAPKEQASGTRRPSGWPRVSKGASVTRASAGRRVNKRKPPATTPSRSSKRRQSPEQVVVSALEKMAELTTTIIQALKEAKK